jgi:hypothetical protein
MIINVEYVRIWKKAFVIDLKALSQHCLGESGENWERGRQGAVVLLSLSEQEWKG